MCCIIAIHVTPDLMHETGQSGYGRYVVLEHSCRPFRPFKAIQAIQTKAQPPAYGCARSAEADGLSWMPGSGLSFILGPAFPRQLSHCQLVAANDATPGVWLHPSNDPVVQLEAFHG